MAKRLGHDAGGTEWDGPHSPNEQIQKLWRLLDRSVPAGGLAGIRIRVHVTFFLLLGYAVFTTESLTLTARWMTVLFISVLLHEFGHCFACRRVGGEANEVLIWPLGGLAWCSPPFTARANFITTAGGPAVNLILAVAAWMVLRLKDGATPHVGFNPLQPWVLPAPGVASMIVGDVFIVNYLLLLLNLALVFYPFDGGRLIQAGLWSRVGYERSVYVASVIGLGGATIAALWGLWQGRTLLVMLAAFGGHASYQRMRQSREGSRFGGDEVEWWQRGEESPSRRRGFFGEWAERWGSARRRRAADRAKAREGEIDRILEKVATRGLGSLTSGEKRALRRETERKRRAR